MTACRTNSAMNSTVSNFFSRDALLSRQLRTYSRKNTPTTPKFHRSSSLKDKFLHIIPEEDELRASSSRTPSPSPVAIYSPSLSAGGSQSLGVKAKRRHANLSISDIKVAREVYVHRDANFTNDDSLLFTSSPPRPAPRPPTSSPDSTSHESTTPIPSPDSFRLTFTDISFKFPHPPLPTPSSLSCRTGSESPTPSLASISTSSSPGSHTTGLPMTPSSSDDEFPSPRVNHRRVSIKPLIITKHNTGSPVHDLSAYTKSELLQPFKNQHEQKESFHSCHESESESEPESDSEWYSREFSKILTFSSPLPPSFPLPSSRPESTSFSPLPPAIKRTTSKHISDIPDPILSPTTDTPSFPSAQLDPAFPRRRRSIPKRAPPPPPVPPIPVHLRSQSSQSLSLRRPPPRMSIPADFGFFDEDADLDVETASLSTGSVYSQDEVDLEFGVDVQFDLDLNVPMRLPLSLPCSPIDLEADIASGLEELRLRGGAVESEKKEEMQPVTPETSAASIEKPRAPESGKALKSRWSSSTLSSLKEEHERRGASSKLRLYFGGHGVKKGGRGRKGSSTSSVTPSPSPTSPSKRFRHAKGLSRDSDVMVIGYGYGQTEKGIRRRVSMSGSSVAGSETGSVESGGSTGSGLRRKPIPVEMFLRTAG